MSTSGFDTLTAKLNAKTKHSMHSTTYVRGCAIRTTRETSGSGEDIIELVNYNDPKVFWKDVEEGLDMPFQMAADTNDFQMLEELFQKGKVNMDYASGILEDAIEAESWGLVKFLLKHGVKRDSLGDYATAKVLWTDDVELFEQLYDMGIREQLSEKPEMVNEGAYPKITLHYRKKFSRTPDEYKLQDLLLNGNAREILAISGGYERYANGTSIVPYYRVKRVGSEVLIDEAPVRLLPEDEEKFKIADVLLPPEYDESLQDYFLVELDRCGGTSYLPKEDFENALRVFVENEDIDFINTVPFSRNRESLGIWEVALVVYNMTKRINGSIELDEDGLNLNGLSMIALEDVLTRYVDGSSENIDNQTLLLLSAARAGDIRLLGDIYKYKINNELCDNTTSTIVSSVIGKLIAHSGNLGSIKCARETLGLKSIPLEDAMDERDIEILEYLIGDYHVTPDERPYDDTMNMAIREGGLPIVRLLKNHGYGIVDRDCNLLEAVKCISDIKLRDYLVENWSKLAVKVPDGYIPTM